MLVIALDLRHENFAVQWYIQLDRPLGVTRILFDGNQLLGVAAGNIDSGIRLHITKVPI